MAALDTIYAYQAPYDQPYMIRIQASEHDI